MPAILFVCLGNICRSPTAEGVMRRFVAEAGLDHRLTVDSAGLGGWHAGDPPDTRAVAAAWERGYDISGQRARKISGGDFSAFDLILGMDRLNVAELQRLRPSRATAGVDLFLQAALGERRDVPDPYYGNRQDFAAVVDACERAAAALVERIAAVGMDNLAGLCRTA